MAIGLFAVAASPTRAIAQTVPQQTPENVGSVVFRGAALHTQRPLIEQVLGQRQESGEYVPAAVYRAPLTSVAQKPFAQILGQRQESGEYLPAAVYSAPPPSTEGPKPVIAPVLTTPQTDLTNAPSATYHVQAAQRSLWTAVVTVPQADLTNAPSAVYGLKLGLQTPALGPWVQTTPQENQQLAPSAVYGQVPPTAVVGSPPTRSAVLTRAEWPQVGPSSVSTTNIALALAAPAPRGSIGTVAEQPLSVQSWSLVNTALLPSFVAGNPALRGSIGTLPQPQILYEVNASWVGTPGPLLPSAPPATSNLPLQINLSLSMIRMGGNTY